MLTRNPLFLTLGRLINVNYIIMFARTHLCESKKCKFDLHYGPNPAVLTLFAPSFAQKLDKSRNKSILTKTKI